MYGSPVHLSRGSAVSTGRLKEASKNSALARNSLERTWKASNYNMTLFNFHLQYVLFILPYFLSFYRARPCEVRHTRHTQTHTHRQTYTDTYTHRHTQTHTSHIDTHTHRHTQTHTDTHVTHRHTQGLMATNPFIPALSSVRLLDVSGRK